MCLEIVKDMESLKLMAENPQLVENVLLQLEKEFPQIKLRGKENGNGAEWKWYEETVQKGE